MKINLTGIILSFLIITCLFIIPLEANIIDITGEPQIAVVKTTGSPVSSLLLNKSLENNLSAITTPVPSVLSKPTNIGQENAILQGNKLLSNCDLQSQADCEKAHPDKVTYEPYKLGPYNFKRCVSKPICDTSGSGGNSAVVAFHGYGTPNCFLLYSCNSDTYTECTITPTPRIANRAPAISEKSTVAATPTATQTTSIQTYSVSTTVQSYNPVRTVQSYYPTQTSYNPLVTTTSYGYAPTSSSGFGGYSPTSSWGSSGGSGGWSSGGGSWGGK